jgi:hypothetical protein
MTPSELGQLQHVSQSAWQQLQQAITNLRPQHFPVEDREQLATLLIQKLAYSLQAESLAEFWTHCQEYGEAVDTISVELSGLSPQLELPNSLPNPHFIPATRVRWKPLSADPDATDTGITIGSFYAPSQHGWNWKYLVLLDRSSYSRQFCIADTAWESDLERLP